MATNTDNSGAGPQRAKRGAKKKSTATLAAGTEVEDIVVRQGGAKPGGWSPFRRRVRGSEVTSFLRQFILLLEAGTPILKTLKTLAQRGKSEERRALVGEIADYVEAGNPLWQSFDRHPQYFDTVFVNLVKASEASGTLTTVLRRSVSYREERELLRKRVIGATVYPIMLVAACFGVMLLLTHLVVPEFKATFASMLSDEEMALEMPALTRYFMASSEIFRVWWWTPIAAILLVLVVYKVWWVRNPLRRLTADRIKMRIPIVGPIIQNNAIVELSRTMALLLRSGLSMMATLDLTRDAIHNRAVSHTLQAVRDSVERGGGLEGPLREAAPVIPDEVTDMFVTGEESGRVDVIADQIADHFDEEVKIAVNTMGETIQPIFTVVVGVAVIILFVALFLPIITMIDTLTGVGGV